MYMHTNTEMTIEKYGNILHNLFSTNIDVILIY